jgi:hypothetical protein
LLRIPNRSEIAEWNVRAATEEGNYFRILNTNDVADGSAGKRIDVNDIMSRAAPISENPQMQDAEMKGG